MSNKKLYFSVLSGIFLEYFDYTLYAFAIVYITKAFFPASNSFISSICAWLAFAISFLVRPLGAILLGHFADKKGRRFVLLYSIFFMSISTIGIGLIPPYSKIGGWATFLLFLSRIVQGFFVSTEYSGSSTYLLEVLPNRRGLNSGIITAMSDMGMFAASVTFLLFTKHWREGFVIAGLIVGILGVYSRVFISESPEFLSALKSHKIVKIPFIKLIKEHFKHLMIGVLFSAYVGIAFCSIEMYFPNYLIGSFSFSHMQASILVTYIIILEAILAIIIGYLSDYYEIRKILIIGCVSMFFFIFPTILLFFMKSSFFWYIAASILSLLLAIVDGPAALFLVSLFPTEVRYTGVSSCYNFGAAIFAGLTPVLLLLIGGNNNYMILPIYVMIAVTLCSIVMIMTLSTYRKQMERYSRITL